MYIWKNTKASFQIVTINKTKELICKYYWEVFGRSGINCMRELRHAIR